MAQSIFALNVPKNIWKT